MKNFNRLSDVRKMHKMNKKQFASFLGLQYTTYDGYEKGVRDTPSNVLVLIAKKCNISIDYILGTQDEPSVLNRINLTPEELLLIETCRRLNEDGRRNVQNQASLLVASGLYSEAVSREKMA